MEYRQQATHRMEQGERSLTDSKGGHHARWRREEKEPELRDVHYHIFGIAGVGDVDYKRQLIKVLQESIRDMNQDVFDLANRTEEAMQMITSVTTHLAREET